MLKERLENEIQEFKELINDCTESIRRIEKLEDINTNQKRIYNIRMERDKLKREKRNLEDQLEKLTIL